MSLTELDNLNPTVYDVAEHRDVTAAEQDDSIVDPFDAREVFDLIRNIKDPEHPLTLEQLNVVSKHSL